VLKYQDWVWSVVARGGLLLVASGPEVHVHDLPTGKLVRKVSAFSRTNRQMAVVALLIDEVWLDKLHAG
jgi:hypothetical protein